MPPSTPNKGLIKALLQKVLDSHTLRKNPREKEFLRFVVEAKLDGREAEIKGSAIDAALFANTEGTSRLAATRLRSKLAMYYQEEGAGDAVQIHIPNVGYVPEFIETAVKHPSSGYRQEKQNLSIVPSGQATAAVFLDTDQSILEQSRQHCIENDSDVCSDLKPSAEINNFLSKQSLTLDSIDEYIELESYPLGWCRKEVVVVDAGPYTPSAHFLSLMRRFKAAPPIRKYHSLQEVESRVQDEQRKLIVYLKGGDWQCVHALSEIVKNPGDPECRDFRKRCERDFMPTPTSGLYRNVNCEVLVVSSDNQIVLGRRRVSTKSGEIVPVFGGAWAASLEEQMLRGDPEGKKKPDDDLFACAHRGVEEELQVTVDPEATRLLGYGLEWGNFTAAFLFLVRTREDFEKITKAWRRAEDRNEAVVLDALPADEGNIRKALVSDRWFPSVLARTWAGQQAITTDSWHPTARARLCAYLRHLKARASDSLNRSR
jgi:hypothetical protein